MFDLRRILGLEVNHLLGKKPPQNIGQKIAHNMSYLNQNPQHNNLQVQSQHSPANLGVPYSPYNDSGLGQGGAYNPGFTPLQGSTLKLGQNPQFGAFSNPQTSYLQVNPQNNQRQQYWLQ